MGLFLQFIALTIGGTLLSYAIGYVVYALVGLDPVVGGLSAAIPCAVVATAGSLLAVCMVGR